MDAVPGMPSRDGRCLRAAEGNLSRSSDTGADGTDGAARKHAAPTGRRRRCWPISCPLNRLRRMRPCASVPSGSASGSTTRSCRKLRARSQTDDRCQLEMQLPGDRRKEFVISIDTAHVRSADQHSARNFELVVARCGRGGRGERGGRYFVTGSTDQQAIRDRALHSLQEVGYRDFGDVTVISDGTEIIKRLTRAMPKPTTHIIDWFHIAMNPAHAADRRSHRTIRIRPL